MCALPTCRQWCLPGLLLLLLSVPALAQAPDRVMFQGRLLRADGQPETGTQTLRFAIYAAPTGGVPLWEETHVDVPVQNGAYAVLLGSSKSLAGVFDGQVRYLGVSLQDQSEMLPRLVIASVPYALQASDSETLQGASKSDFAPVSHTHPDATTSSSGFLSSSDKQKLDALPGQLSCTRRAASGSSTAGVTATCQAGETLTGGGCEDMPLSGFGSVDVTQAPTTNGFRCAVTGGTTSLVTAWAICCRIVP